MDCSGALHGSVFPPAEGAGVAVTVASSDGSMVGVSVTTTIGVSVGKSVCVDVSVGGMDVNVGITACVSATTVNAAAIALL